MAFVNAVLCPPCTLVHEKESQLRAAIRRRGLNALIEEAAQKE